MGEIPEESLGQCKSSRMREWLCVGPLRIVAGQDITTDIGNEPNNQNVSPDESDDEMEQEQS